MMRGIQKLAEIDSSTLAGGAAGIGAAALTSTLMQGSIAAKEQALRAALGSYAKAKSAPLIAGAVTALIVGAMVASKMRAREKAQIVPFTPQQAMFQQQGFYPGERTHIGVPQQYTDPVLPF
jgi:hypothetical protein